MHPAYTRGFLTRLEDNPAGLIERAYASRNAARYLCVKGRTDYICTEGKIINEISTPVIEELEPVGGTGDTITGMVAGLAHHGYNCLKRAALPVAPTVLPARWPGSARPRRYRRSFPDTRCLSKLVTSS